VAVGGLGSTAQKLLQFVTGSIISHKALAATFSKFCVVAVACDSPVLLVA